MSSKQMSNSVKTSLMYFILGLGFMLVRINSDSYPDDSFNYINILVALVVGGSAYVLFVMSPIDHEKLTKYYSRIFCPMFLVVVVISLFAILPFETLVLERDGSKSPELKSEFFWHNPVTTKVFDYRHEIFGHVGHDSILVRYDYNGTLLEFHEIYRGRHGEFDSYAQQKIIDIISSSTIMFKGNIRIDQLQYLYHELPKALLGDIIVFENADVVRYASFSGIVVDTIQ